MVFLKLPDRIAALFAVDHAAGDQPGEDSTQAGSADLAERNDHESNDDNDHPSTSGKTNEGELECGAIGKAIELLRGDRPPVGCHLHRLGLHRPAEVNTCG